MRIARFISGGEIFTGRMIDDQSAYVISGNPVGDFEVTGVQKKIDKLLAPIIPTEILCIGLNYREHARESGAAIPEHPVLFMKNGSAINNPDDPVVLPKLSSQVDYECELAVIIGLTAKNVSRQDALDYVLGYTCANDISARDWQRDMTKSGGQWCRAKSFDGFCPLGPWMVTTDEVPDPNKLRIQTLLNGQVMQDSLTSDMIFDVATIIQSLSSTMTLRPGTVILTGTPQGVGFARKPPVFLKPGDQLSTEIQGIGRLNNPVMAEA